MAKPLKYNPKAIVGSFQGKTPQGRDFVVKFVAFMDGTFVEVEYNEDRVTRHDGADGTPTYVVTAGKGAKLMVTFAQGSPVNTLLSQLIPDAEKNYMPTGILSFEDLNGNTKVKDTDSVISKVAKVSFGDKVEGRQWTFEMAAADIFVGEGGDF